MIRFLCCLCFVVCCLSLGKKNASFLIHLFVYLFFVMTCPQRTTSHCMCKKSVYIGDTNVRPAYCHLHPPSSLNFIFNPRPQPPPGWKADETGCWVKDTAATIAPPPVTQLAFNDNPSDETPIQRLRPQYGDIHSIEQRIRDSHISDKPSTSWM